MRIALVNNVAMVTEGVCRVWAGTRDYQGAWMAHNRPDDVYVLHRDGHHTIGQDNLNSAVYGIPRAAADLRATTEIPPLDRSSLRNIVAQEVTLHG